MSEIRDYIDKGTVSAQKRIVSLGEQIEEAYREIDELQAKVNKHISFLKRLDYVKSLNEIENMVAAREGSNSSDRESIVFDENDFSLKGDKVYEYLKSISSGELINKMRKRQMTESEYNLILKESEIDVPF